MWVYLDLVLRTKTLGYKWQKTKPKQDFQTKILVGHNKAKNPRAGMLRTRAHTIRSSVNGI